MEAFAPQGIELRRERGFAHGEIVPGRRDGMPGDDGQLGPAGAGRLRREEQREAKPARHQRTRRTPRASSCQVSQAPKAAMIPAILRRNIPCP